MTATTGTGTHAWVQGVAEQIRRRCPPPGTGVYGPVWVDGGVHDDGSLVVLYRPAAADGPAADGPAADGPVADGPVVGYVRDIRDWPALFITRTGPTSDPVELGNLLYVDQIEDPSSLRHDHPAAELANKWTPPGTTVHWDLDHSHGPADRSP